MSGKPNGLTMIDRQRERPCQRHVGSLAVAAHAGRLLSQERSVVAMAAVYPAQSTSSRHAHRRAQFILQTAGVTSMLTDRGNFVIPPEHGLWIPAGVVHQSRAWGEVEARSIYVEPSFAPSHPKDCRLLRASPLLQALMDEVVRMPTDYDEQGRDGQVIELLVSEILRMPEVALHVPMPQDTRLARICEAVIADSSSDRTLDEWADDEGLSRRTLTRLFRRETGQSFAAWRQRVRLLEALARLGTGEAVTTVALDVGYESPSAFSAMFKRELGSVPRSYMKWIDQEVIIR